ncbi:MAG: ribonuclease D [Saccharospirillaceae bacterium]|nr:ribonuclease D [Saccharospirillaceae bacterium]MCD8530002.1 ribonuclease D [Saccharospirillaceae bacterium]
MTRLKIPEPQWITTGEQLQDACRLWCQEAYLAVDTEFVRTTTFYPEAGLLQIADSHGSYLIDPLTISDWQPLVEVLLHPLVVKVFHACSEDLEVFRRLTGVVPAPLADTQIGGAMAGLGASLGFQRLVKEVLNINLPKEETRSNWLMRPLREEQISYAVADVHYLYRLYPKLVSLLKKLGRQSWLAEDCERLLTLSEKAEKASLYFRRVKLAWKLRPQELLLLQHLVLWREQQARERNVPRSKVVDDNCLWNIARFKPRNRDQLIKAGMRPQSVREDGKILLDMVGQIQAMDKSLWPRPLDKPLSPQAGQWLKLLKETVVSKAELLNIPPDLLARKKALEALVRSGYPNGPFKLPESLSGWRKAEIGDYLMMILQDQTRVISLRKPTHDESAV